MKHKSKLREKHGPLRKIVREYLKVISDGSIDSIIALRSIEVLECGHEQHPKIDIYGNVNAYARRCRQCLKSK